MSYKWRMSEEGYGELDDVEYREKHKMAPRGTLTPDELHILRLIRLRDPKGVSTSVLAQKFGVKRAEYVTEGLWNKGLIVEMGV